MPSSQRLNATPAVQRPPLRRRSESMIRSRCADEKDPLDDLLKKRKASREEAAPEVRLLESLLDSANQELLAIWEQRRLLEAENMALRLDLEALAEEASLARATIETMNSIAEEDEEEQFETATSTTRWEEPPDHGITETPTPCSRKPGNEALKASKAAPLSMPHASSIPGTPPRNEPVVVASRDLELSAAESDTCKQTRIGIEHMRHGKLAEARIAFEAAVASSSDGDAEGLAARGHLAGVLYQLGDFDEAEKHLEVVLAAEEGRLGSDDPSVLRTRQNLANVYSGQGKLQMAQEICEAVAKRQEERLGKDHPDTVTTLCSLAGLLYEMGEMSAALEAYEDLLPRMSNLMGEEHPNTRTIKNNLAGVLWQQMDLAGARRLYEEVLASDQKLLGDDHPDTLTTCSNMAGVLGDMGDHIGAAELYETVLAKQNKILGPDHPSTQITRQNLQIELQHQPVVQNLCLPPPATATDILAVS